MKGTIRCGLLSAALASALFAQSASALTPQTGLSALTRGVEQTEAGVDRLDGRYKTDGVAVTLGEPAFTAKAAAPETMAREFLAARHSQLGLKADEASSLARTTLREGRHFSVVRFEQRRQGLPVYGSDIAVSVRPDGKIIYVANSAVGGLGAPRNADTKTDADALAIAKRYLGVSELGYQKLRKMVYASPNGTRIVWRVDVAAKSSELAGRWEVLVDAQSGEVLRAQDKALDADGTGTVWTPDPLSYKKVAYGGGYVDGNNADTPELTAALVSVTLPDISQDGAGNYVLSGPYAVCKDWDTPHHAGECPAQGSSDFSITRSAESFDAVMVYYHLSRYMKYVNETVGITAMPLEHTGGVVYDPHGWNGEDNSRYAGGANDLTFGQGGVDDAQDADVIVHELGHGLHDWITGGHLSQVQGLSEGFGDYTAGSYSRDYPDQWAPTDAAYNWVYNWDGHSVDTWAGRVLNWHLNHTYSDIADDQQEIHVAGQYWSSCNLEARKNIQALDPAAGGRTFDKAYFQGLSMTGGSTNQKDAAQAVINAAAALGFTQAQIDAIGVAYNSGNQNGNTGCTYNVTVPGAGTDPKIVVDPTTLSGTAEAGASTTVPLTIRNTGGGSLEWSIAEAADAARGHFPRDLRQATPIGVAHQHGPKLAPTPGSTQTATSAATAAVLAAVNGYAQRSSNTASNRALKSLDFNTPGTLTTVGAPNQQPFWGAGFLNGDTSKLYMLGDSGLYSVDTATGAATQISASAGGGDVWAMTADPTTQKLFWIGPSLDQELSTVDPATGATTLVAAISGAAAGDTITGIAANAQGQLFGIDADSDSLISIDKATGDTAVIGSLGMDANNVAGLVFDPGSGTLYFADGATGMYTVNVTTGAATLIGTVQDGAQLVAMAIGGGGTPPGGCTHPSDVPWLSASSTSGTATAGGSSAVTITLNATGLAAGRYDANLCVASNDATNPLVAVPVSFTVTGGSSDACAASDTIFCDGFDGAGSGPFEQPVQDPGFEATPGDTEANPFWTGTDSNDTGGGTPFYSTAQGQAHTGKFAAWGGGWRQPGTQAWSQSMTIASGGPRFLNYWRLIDAAPDGTATLTISVDGTAVSTTDVVANGEDADWTNISVDLGTYADDAAHEIKFEYHTTGAEDGNCFVDDITIDETAAAARPRPPQAPVAGNANARRTKHR